VLISIFDDEGDELATTEITGVDLGVTRRFRIEISAEPTTGGVLRIIWVNTLDM
jgi:hypothetical protein